MLLHDNWKAILRHAWTVRLLVIAGVLSGLEVALPVVADYLPFPPYVVAVLLFIVVVAAFIARFIAQKELGAE